MNTEIGIYVYHDAKIIIYKDFPDCENTISVWKTASETSVTVTQLEIGIWCM